MNLKQILEHPIFTRATVLTGSNLADREVRWVHSVNEPDPLPWIGRGQLLLSTGQGISRDELKQQQLIWRLQKKGVAALAIAVPRYFPEVPETLIREAAKADLPVIELPWNLPFVEITEAVHQLMLSEQHQMLVSSAVIHRTLTQAAMRLGSLQELASVLGELISRAVVIEALDGSLIGVHRHVESEDVIRTLTLEAGRSTAEWEHFVEALGMKPELDASSTPVRIPGSADGRIAPRVVCPIVVFGTRAATVVIIEGNRPLTDLDIRAAEHAATIGALYISHQREIAATEARVGANLLDALLESGDDLSAASLERLRVLGLSECHEWKLVVAELPLQIPMGAREIAARDKVARDMTDTMKLVGARGLVTSHTNRVICLVPADITQRLISHLPLDKYRVVTTSTFDDLTLAAQKHKTVQRILPMVGGPGHYQFEDFLTARLLVGDNAATMELVERYLLPLSESPSGEGLVSTLRSLYRNCFHLNNTASELAIHISTLRYRLHRIETLLHIDLKNSSDRFSVQLALEASALFFRQTQRH